MDIFSIDVTHNEIVFLRQALDMVTVSGKDAKFLANLQMKLENELTEIQNMKVKEEEKKQRELKVVLEAETIKSSKK
jgi:acid phosphatase family membrane protein YuiD